jgi:hypothetical protein
VRKSKSNKLGFHATICFKFDTGFDIYLNSPWLCTVLYAAKDFGVDLEL